MVVIVIFLYYYLNIVAFVLFSIPDILSSVYLNLLMILFTGFSIYFIAFFIYNISIGVVVFLNLTSLLNSPSMLTFFIHTADFFIHVAYVFLYAAAPFYMS